MPTEKATKHHCSINICTATEGKMLMRSILDTNISAFHYKAMNQNRNRRQLRLLKPSVEKAKFKQNPVKFNQELVPNILSGNEWQFCFSPKTILLASLKRQQASSQTRLSGTAATAPDENKGSKKSSFWINKQLNNPFCRLPDENKAEQTVPCWKLSERNKQTQPHTWSLKSYLLLRLAIRRTPVHNYREGFTASSVPRASLTLKHQCWGSRMMQGPSLMAQAFRTCWKRI